MQASLDIGFRVLGLRYKAKSAKASRGTQVHVLLHRERERERERDFIRNHEDFMI